MSDDLEAGDIVEFEHDGGVARGIITYHTGVVPYGEFEGDARYSAKVPSDVDSNRWTTLYESDAEKVGEVDDKERLDPRFIMPGRVDELQEADL